MEESDAVVEEAKPKAHQPSPTPSIRCAPPLRRRAPLGNECETSTRVHRPDLAARLRRPAPGAPTVDLYALENYQPFGIREPAEAKELSAMDRLLDLKQRYESEGYSTSLASPLGARAIFRQRACASPALLPQFTYAFPARPPMCPVLLRPWATCLHYPSAQHLARSSFRMVRSVKAVLLVHIHGHPHVLLLQPTKGYHCLYALRTLSFSMHSHAVRSAATLGLVQCLSCACTLACDQAWGTV